jgi:serine/threonine protein kinase
MTVNSDPFLGRILDRKYRLGAMIGRGAIGRVYLATQICLDREIAIKILHPGYGNHPEAAARFRLEACAASRLQHPGIVTVFDWGQDEDGLLYLAIEYMPGIDLFEIAQKQAPIASDRIARLMEQVGRALSHAHSHGVIHRDLKPENLRVMVDPLGPEDRREIVKIYDFGIAHVAQEIALGSTEVGALVGTPYYMSPEQAGVRPVVPESDLYACGVIMFLLATGQLPFVAASPLEVASLHVRQPAPRPSDLNPNIDPRLERIILRCLAKRPSDRPRSGVDLAAMLAPIARGPRGDASVQADTEPPVVAAERRRVARGRSLQWTTAWAIGATSALGTMLASEWKSHSWDGAAMASDARECATASAGSPTTRSAVEPAADDPPSPPPPRPTARIHATGAAGSAAPLSRPAAALRSPATSPLF